MGFPRLGQASLDCDYASTYTISAESLRRDDDESSIENYLEMVIRLAVAPPGR